MIRYGWQATPWAKVLPAVALVVVQMELVARWPYTTWALQGSAVGLLAAAVAWSLDEPAADVVDTSPRSLAWRTCARTPALALVLASWVLSVVRSWASLGGHGPTILVQGTVAIFATGAYATWRRANGHAMPGTAIAAGVLSAGVGLPLARTSEWIPVFPYVAAPNTEWTASARGWGLLGVAALTLLAAGLCDAKWQTHHHRSAMTAGAEAAHDAQGPIER